MKFLFDTNAVIAILKTDPAFLTRLRRHHPSEFGLSAIVLHELHFGAAKSRRVAENHARIDALRFERLAFDPEDARCAGEVRARLAVARTPIGPYDSLIAGQAMARDLTLISRNRREFDRVVGLRVEDWEE